MALDIMGLDSNISVAIATLGILITGLIVTRLIAKLGYKVTKKDSHWRILVKATQYLLIILTIFLSVYFWDENQTLGAKMLQPMLEQLGEYAPAVMTAIVILVLGVMLVNLFMEIINVFLSGLHFKSYLRDIGIRETFMRIPIMALRVILYLIVLNAFFTQLNLSTILGETTGYVTGAFALLVAGLAFVSLKDPVRNWIAGWYLKSSHFLKMGQRVFTDEADGEVVGFSTFATVLDTGKGYFIAVPHSTLINQDIRIKKSRFELKTLESMRRHYIAQESSYCVPAVLNIVLTLFGYPVKGGQKTLAKEAKTKVPGGTSPKNAMSAVKRMTEGEVQGLMVPYKDIINLKEEVKAWLSEGALLVLNFYKAALFPGVKREQKHAVLCMGIEGDELLIMDPNSNTGGVYLVNYKDMERAMGPFEGDERGYIAYAPRGTKAYWRVKNKLYYSDPIHYEKLSKGIERKLKQVFRQSKRVKDVFPSYLREFIDEFKSTEVERIERLWKP